MSDAAARAQLVVTKAGTEKLQKYEGRIDPSMLIAIFNLPARTTFKAVYDESGFVRLLARWSEPLEEES